jgi:regulatory protein
MSRITKISVQKNTERLNIYLDGIFAFGIKQELLGEYDLRVGKELSSGDITKINKEDELKRCLDKAYRYLSYRPRSEKEVTDKLLEKYPEKTVAAALKKLKEYKYVDDVAFIKFWLDSRANSRGPALLRLELSQKGVPKTLIDESLSIIDKDALIEDGLKLVRGKKKYRDLDANDLYQKVAPFLSRRGYPYDVIKIVLKNMKSED